MDRQNGTPGLRLVGTTGFPTVGRILHIDPTGTWGHVESVCTGQVYYWHISDQGIVLPSFELEYPLLVHDPNWKAQTDLRKLDIIRFVPGMAPRGPRALLWTPAKEYRRMLESMRQGVRVLKQYMPVGLFG